MTTTSAILRICFAFLALGGVGYYLARAYCALMLSGMAVALAGAARLLSGCTARAGFSPNGRSSLGADIFCFGSILPRTLGFVTEGIAGRALQNRGRA